MSDGASESMSQIEEEVRQCTKCELHKGRKNAVPGEGSVKAKMMFVGEAPGHEEDSQGRPFVGAAGMLLNQLLSSIGLRRDEVYITNIVKCRPPENRPPRVVEVEACSSYLKRQINIVNPKVLCPMGNVAVRVFLGKDVSISKLHGQSISNRESRTIYPLYHPAAALYMAKLKNVLGEDFKRLAKEGM